MNTYSFGTFVLVSVLLTTAQLAVAGRAVTPLDEDEYRTDLEEIVVTATAPKAPSWRPKGVPDFSKPKVDVVLDLPESLRIMPAYNVEERDTVSANTDKRDERALIRLFEFDF